MSVLVNANAPNTNEYDSVLHVSNLSIYMLVCRCCNLLHPGSGRNQSQTPKSESKGRYRLICVRKILRESRR